MTRIYNLIRGARTARRSSNNVDLFGSGRRRRRGFGGGRARSSAWRRGGADFTGWGVGSEIRVINNTTGDREKQEWDIGRSLGVRRDGEAISDVVNR